jgi:hypothetical protein
MKDSTCPETPRKRKLGNIEGLNVPGKAKEKEIG